MRRVWSCTKADCMSTTDVAKAPAAAGEQPASPAVPAFPKPDVQSPIVPQSTISARALFAVVAIMTFLASLTLGAAVMVRSVANDWQSDVSREVTIQIRPTAGRDIEADIVKSYRELSRRAPAC